MPIVDDFRLLFQVAEPGGQDFVLFLGPKALDQFSACSLEFSFVDRLSFQHLQHVRAPVRGDHVAGRSLFKPECRAGKRVPAADPLNEVVAAEEF